MATFGFLETTGVVGWIALTGFQLSGGGRFHKSYAAQAPRWAREAIIWSAHFMASVVLAVTGFYFTQFTTPDSWQLIVGFSALVAHILLIKLWCGMMFHGMAGGAHGAAWISVLKLLTAVAFICAAVINPDAANGLYWVPLMTFLVYFVFFYCGGAYLNACILYPGTWGWTSRSHHHHHHHHHETPTAPPLQTPLIHYRHGMKDDE